MVCWGRPTLYWRGRGSWRRVLNVNGQLHAAVAESIAADEVVHAGHIQWDDISAGTCGPVVERVVRVARLVVGRVHLEHVHLVPIIHENCREARNKERSISIN